MAFHPTNMELGIGSDVWRTNVVNFISDREFEMLIFASIDVR